jgi:hypothetical protein
MLFYFNCRTLQGGHYQDKVCLWSFGGSPSNLKPVVIATLIKYLSSSINKGWPLHFIYPSYLTHFSVSHYPVFWAFLSSFSSQSWPKWISNGWLWLCGCRSSLCFSLAWPFLYRSVTPNLVYEGGKRIEKHFQTPTQLMSANVSVLDRIHGMILQPVTWL